MELWDSSFSFLITKEIFIYFINFELHFNFIITEVGPFFPPNHVLHYYKEYALTQILSLCDLTKYLNVHYKGLVHEF